MSQPRLELKQRIIQEINEFSPDSLAEVLHFVELLKSRRKGVGIELAIASERTLAKDWLSPQEDEAWRDL